MLTFAVDDKPRQKEHMPGMQGAVDRWYSAALQ